MGTGEGGRIYQRWVHGLGKGWDASKRPEKKRAVGSYRDIKTIESVAVTD